VGAQARRAGTAGRRRHQGGLGRGDLDEGIEAEKAGFARVFASEDAREGIGAFLGKRQPAWRGR
jgi:enoyl-CoA hydratase/carnithine racemase